MHSTLQLIEIGAIILALGLLGAVSNRFSISPIPFYLIAGLAFGTGGIYPLTTSEDDGADFDELDSGVHMLSRR